MKGRSANVTSVEALDRFSVALRQFQEEASVALDELGMEIHRAVEWIQVDRKHYWNEQIRRSYQQVAEARIALERKQMFRVGDERPSCYDEKKALEAAKRRLALSQEKIETVRRWSMVVAQAVMEYKADIGPFAQWVSLDLLQAIAAVQQMGDALDRYLNIAAIETQTPDGQTLELGESAARAGSAAVTRDSVAESSSGPGSAEESHDADAAKVPATESPDTLPEERPEEHQP